MRKAAATILSYLALVALAVLGIHATAQAAPTGHQTHATAPAPAFTSYDVTAEDLVSYIASYGLDTSGLHVVVTDDPMLNCGSAISPQHTGGGCTIAGGTSHAVLIVSPTAGDHVLFHEYAHARYASSECAAERFANATTGLTQWSYPTCAQGIEPVSAP